MAFIFLFTMTGPKWFFLFFFSFLYWAANLADKRAENVSVEPVRRKKKGETPEVFEGDTELYADFINWKWNIRGEEYHPGDEVERYGDFAEFLQYRLDRSEARSGNKKSDQAEEKVDEKNSEGSTVDGSIKKRNSFQVTAKNVMRIFDCGFDPDDNSPEIDNPIHAAYSDDNLHGEWTDIKEVMARIEAKKEHEKRKVKRNDF